jgi:hypothetical protein
MSLRHPKPAPATPSAGKRAGALPIRCGLLLVARRLAHEAGVPFPDGVPYPDALAAEIAKHERLVIEWDPAGASSGLGRRTFRCLCGRGRAHGAGRLSGFGALPGRVAVVAQAQLNGAYRQAVEGGRRREQGRVAAQGTPGGAADRRWCRSTRLTEWIAVGQERAERIR